MKSGHWIFVFLLIGFQSFTQVQQHRQLREGDREYEGSNFSDAEEKYRRANNLKGSFRGSYNLGNSIYQQERYEEAVKQFESALDKSSSPESLAKAYHNLGNTYYNQQEFDKSVDAYKNSLRYQPKDWETKRNLVMAMNKMIQQQQQQQQQQDQNQDQQQQQQQNPQQGQSNSDVTDQELEEPQNELNKQDAEELLKIVDREDQRVQEKLKKSSGKKKKPEKDW